MGVGNVQAAASPFRSALTSYVQQQPLLCALSVPCQAWQHNWTGTMRLAVLGPWFNAWHDFITQQVVVPLRHLWYYSWLWDVAPIQDLTSMFGSKSQCPPCGCLDLSPLQQDLCWDCYNLWRGFLLQGQSASGPTRYTRTSGYTWCLTESDWICLADCSTVPLYCSQSAILSLFPSSSSSSSLSPLHVSRAHCVAGLVFCCPNPWCLDHLIR